MRKERCQSAPQLAAECKWPEDRASVVQSAEGRAKKCGRPHRTWPLRNIRKRYIYNVSYLYMSSFLPPFGEDDLQLKSRGANASRER